jgi:FkbM family methyltransferase
MNITAVIAKIFIQPTNIKKKIRLERLFHEKICEIIKIRHDIFFIYIGANDGKSGNHIFEYVKKYSIGGVLVEPQKEQFKKLQKNYKSFSAISMENSAIVYKRGSVDFFTSGFGFSSSVLPPSYFIGVSNRRSKRKSGVTKVSGITFSDLIRKHNIDEIDLIIIDTEGYDYEILKQIDLNRFKPAIIYYESVLLKQSDRIEAERHLQKHNYSVYSDGWYTLAFINDS